MAFITLTATLPVRLYLVLEVGGLHLYCPTITGPQATGNGCELSRLVAIQSAKMIEHIVVC